ncbi:hypothetical protein QTO30_20105 [Yoonia sp. GPGPB17]|uniref:hypothetical protein n=1 Tax=Yoonia sp. GPGPB17 TaxID=3026147 RepID=UPI0030C2C0B4
MRFEVTEKREERVGFIFKKPSYAARTDIHLTDDEYDALQSMAVTKQWMHYPLGEISMTVKHRKEFTMEMASAWSKKTKSIKKNIRTELPEERELQISEMKDLATNLKQVLEARLSSLQSSDDDVAIEL